LACHAPTFLASGGGSQAEGIWPSEGKCVNPAFIAPPQDRFRGGFRIKKITRIQSSGMRLYVLRQAVLPFFFVVALGAGHSRAAEEGHTFIIAGAEGYGVEDCLAEGGECGRVVADAWCEAHGHGAAISFGVADDVTGAIPASVAADKPRSPYVIRCGD
jgi:hypothetical protein